MTSLRQVLDGFRSAKLTAKPSKCLIGYGSIDCLCHNIVDQTVRPQDTGYEGCITAQNKTSNEVISWVGWFLPPFHPQ